MTLWIRLAFRELLRNRRFALFFIMNLSIGLMGFIALDSFNYSIQNHLQSNLKEILTGDLAVYASRPLTEDEKSTIDRVLGPNKEMAHQTTFLTMISTETASRLSRIIAVDDAYPLYGRITLEANEKPSGGSGTIIGSENGSGNGYRRKNGLEAVPASSILDYEGTADSNGGYPNAYVSRDLAITLDVERGDTVRIGTLMFKVGGIVASSPGTSVTAMEFAPSIYIGIPYLKKTGLLGFGSRIRYGTFYRLPQGTDVKAKTVALRKAIADLFAGGGEADGARQAQGADGARQPRGADGAGDAGDAGGGNIGDPPITVFDSEDVNRNLERVFGYFTGYMGLVAIVALFLAGIGTAYLFRSYLDAHIKEMAILMSLGARRMETRLMLLFQVMSLGLISTGVSVIFSLFLLPFFPALFEGLIPSDFKIMANPSGLILASFLGTLGSVIFCLPVLVRIHDLKPLVLLQGGDRMMHSNGSISNGSGSKTERKENETIGAVGSLLTQNRSQKQIRYLFSFLPALITFWLLSIGQTRSFERGTLFLAGFVGVMGIMALIGRGGVALVGRLSQTRNVMRKISFRNLYRHRLTSISCFVTIAMGAFLINVIPQIKNGIQDEIERPQGLNVPGFFLIDIQPEQLTPLGQFLQSQGTKLTNASPMVQGRITQVNGKGFYGRFVEQDGEAKKLQNGRFRRREFIFSWRETLDASESVIEGPPLSGTPWDFESGEPFEISIEEGFADRFDLHIGDSIGFDIQGIPFEGRVVNLRKVRWNSFQPNFFILFQKGVIDDAPRTYLASIPQMEVSKKTGLQSRLIKQFPNISVLDVNQTVKQLLDITDRLTFSINAMAFLAIFAGLVVLFSIVRYETRSRSSEINLLKVLGAGFGDVRRIILLEFGTLGFAASFVAVLMSLGISYGISWFFFGNLWAFRWEYSIVSLFGITFICIVTALMAAGRVIRKKPVALLRSI